MECGKVGGNHREAKNKTKQRSSARSSTRPPPAPPPLPAAATTTNLVIPIRNPEREKRPLLVLVLPPLLPLVAISFPLPILRRLLETPRMAASSADGDTGTRNAAATCGKGRAATAAAAAVGEPERLVGRVGGAPHRPLF